MCIYLENTSIHQLVTCCEIFSQVYDIRAVRVLVPDLKDCYAALGLIHGLWRNIPNEFDDYIANPKDNGYRSLHTAVIGPDGKVLEVQIRTFTMHEEAEFGVCAHWRYKGSDSQGGNSYEDKIAWLRKVLDWHEETDAGPADVAEHFSRAQDRVYVFTPKGDIFDSLVRPIFHQIGVSPVALQTRRTYDDIRQPFSGWGLTLHRNDIALIMNFLQNGGKAGGPSLLDEGMLRSALQQNPKDRGLKAVIDTQRYQNGFWAWNAGPTIGCKGSKYIPVMSGYGGLSAVLFPNGHSYYYVSDGRAFTWARAAKASNDILPFCEKK